MSYDGGSVEYGWAANLLALVRTIEAEIAPAPGTTKPLRNRADSDMLAMLAGPMRVRRRPQWCPAGVGWEAVGLVRTTYFSGGAAKYSYILPIWGFCKSAAMAARYYFHLVDRKDVIRDDFGALAIDLADAHRAAAEIIEEFRIEQAHRYHDWHDWKLVVTDDTAQFALILPLAD